MNIPYYYSFRNLWTRKLTTLLTAGGMALVVYVFATVLMLEEGLRQTLVQTGSYDNVLIIRKSASTEVASSIEREQAMLIEAQPEVAYTLEGNKKLSREMMVLITLPKKDNATLANVPIRGVSNQGVILRPQIKLVQGRLFRPGSSEIIVGSSIAKNFKNSQLGDKLYFGLRYWTVVGIFNAGTTGFDSEIWGDADQLMPAFRRPVYSSVLFQLADTHQFDQLKTKIENDPRLKLEVKRETVFYAEQSETMAKFINILGLTLSVIFSIGAIIGAMITMYASVANRTNEIGTLRALGFKRDNILLAFLIEAVMLGGVGGVIGLAFASLMQFLSISTMNFQTFAELAFTFKLNLTIISQSILFAFVMGLVGGVLPAIRAARMSIIDALRAA